MGAGLGVGATRGVAKSQPPRLRRVNPGCGGAAKAAPGMTGEACPFSALRAGSELAEWGACPTSASRPNFSWSYPCLAAD